VNYIWLDDEDPDEDLPEKYQNWKNEIKKMIRDEVQDSPAYDGEALACHIDW